MIKLGMRKKPIPNRRSSVVHIDIRKRRKEGTLNLKFFGFVGCKACADKWKSKLQRDGKNVRVVPKKGGFEIWAI